MKKKQQGQLRKIYNVMANIYFNYRKKSNTAASTMKTAENTRKVPNVANKPIKHKQTNKSPTIQFSPEKKSTSYVLKKQGPTGTQTSKAACYL